jgi:hypothetical protein
MVDGFNAPPINVDTAYPGDPNLAPSKGISIKKSILNIQGLGDTPI